MVTQHNDTWSSKWPFDATASRKQLMQVLPWLEGNNSTSEPFKNHASRYLLYICQELYHILSQVIQTYSSGIFTDMERLPVSVATHFLVDASLLDVIHCFIKPIVTRFASNLFDKTKILQWLALYFDDGSIRIDNEFIGSQNMSHEFSLVNLLFCWTFNYVRTNYVKLISSFFVKAISQMG